MKSIYCLSVITVLTISCKKETGVGKQEKHSTAIEKANWLIGRWENNSPEGNLSEIWQKMNDSTFAGKTYFVRGYDTLFAETIQLEQRNGKLSYVPVVSNQNSGKPIPFGLTGSSSTQMVFENPEHDYPNKIIYNQVGTDSLVAEIKGTENGREKKEFFKMKKVE